MLTVVRTKVQIGCVLVLMGSPVCGWSKCFSFDQAHIKPIQEPIPLLEGEDAFRKGEIGQGGIVWGAVRGVVNRPPKSIADSFSDPYLTKNKKNTKIDVVFENSPHYKFLRKMHLVLKPVFFVTIEWNEEWALRVLKGTVDDPKSFILYYQKTDGTSHIEHLCGNILVTDRKGGSDIYLYEQVKASRWSNDDVIRNFQVVLKILRGEHHEG